MASLHNNYIFKNPLNNNYGIKSINYNITSSHVDKTNFNKAKHSKKWKKKSINKKESSPPKDKYIAISHDS
jgi:hypothetical protein